MLPSLTIDIEGLSNGFELLEESISNIIKSNWVINKTMARSFIKNLATQEDLDMVKELMVEKRRVTVLENELGIKNQLELNRVEERLSK